MTVETPFPMFIDSSILASITQCEQQAYWRYIRKRAPLGTNIHLLAGGAFAKGLEVARRCYYEQGLSEPDAIAEGLRALWQAYGFPDNLGIDYENHAKSPARMAGALVFYFDSYPMSKEVLVPAKIGDRRMIEFSFTLELPGLIHPETGEPLLYCGRCDEIAEDEAGTLFVVDEKTTSQMGPTWSKQWELRSQFMGYTWAGRESGIDIQGSLVRGVAIRKTGYDTAQSINYFPQWMVDRWLENTCRKLQHFIDSYKSGKYIYNFGNACTDFGGCEYNRLCTSPNPEAWLDGFYQHVEWNPITHESKVLA